MQVQTRQGPAYGVARLTLAPNEPVQVEGGAMMAMSAGVTLQSKAEGGIMKSLKRAALGGESFFVSTYTAPPPGGFVDVAARLPGDITTYDVAPGRALFIQKGSWLANDVTVNLDAKWGGFKNMFGSEGGFIIRAEGQGTWCSPATARSRCGTWRPARRITVDTGHMVAYEDTVHDGHPQGQRRRPGAELEERRGLRVRLHRPRPGVDADPQPERAAWAGFRASSAPATRVPASVASLGGLFGRD